MLIANTQPTRCLLCLSITLATLSQSVDAGERCRLMRRAKCVATPCTPTPRCDTTCRPCYDPPCVCTQFPVVALGGGYYLYYSHEHDDCAQCESFDPGYEVRYGVIETSELCPDCASYSGTTEILPADGTKPIVPPWPVSARDVKKHLRNSSHVEFEVIDSMTRDVAVKYSDKPGTIFARQFYIAAKWDNGGGDTLHDLISVGVELIDPVSTTHVLVCSDHESLDIGGSTMWFHYPRKLCDTPCVIIASR